MPSTLFDTDFVGRNPHDALEFIAKMLHASMDCSLTGEHLVATIALLRPIEPTVFLGETEACLGKKRTS